MGCKKERKRIQKLLDGEIGNSEKARLDGHLKACDGCRSYMEQMAALRKFAEVRKLEGRGEEYWKGYWPRLKPKLAEKRVRRPLPVVRLIRNPVFELAAVVLVAVIVMIRFNVFVFESPALRGGIQGIVAPIRGPESYQHVLGSTPRQPAGPPGRLDRVVDPVRTFAYEHVLEPTRGVGQAARGGVIVI